MDLVTLAELKQKILSAADMQNTDFIEDYDGLSGGRYSELTSMIRCSIQDFYDLLISVWEDYYFKEYTLPTVAGQADYTLPTDFYKLLGLDYNDSSGRIYPAKQFLFRERPQYNSTSSGTQGYNCYYRLFGDTIRIYPIPSSVYNFKLTYIPTPTLPEDDSDSFDFIQGYDDFVKWDVVIKCLSKEESDVSVAMAERKKAEDRINEMAKNRDVSEPQRILNIHAENNLRKQYDSSYPPDDEC